MSEEPRPWMECIKDLLCFIVCLAMSLFMIIGLPVWVLYEAKEGRTTQCFILFGTWIALMGYWVVDEMRQGPGWYVDLD